MRHLREVILIGIMLMIFTGCLDLNEGDLSSELNTNRQQELEEEVERLEVLLREAELCIESFEEERNMLEVEKAQSSSESIMVGGEDDLISNPIDELFRLYPNELSSHKGFIEYSALYCNSWKSEMDNAYQILINHSNETVVDEVIKSRDSYIEYVESGSQVHTFAFLSNAYTGSVDDDLMLFGDFWHNVLEIKASQYQSQTFLLIDFLEWSEIEYEYVFEENEMIDELRKFKLD